MRQFTACVFGAGIMAATGAFAQSSALDGRFYITGYAELGYYDRGPDDSGLFRTDIDMGFAPGDGANGLGFGFSLGIDAIGDDSIEEAALYPALELGTGIGKFSIGIPRSVLDRGYFPEQKFANNTFVNTEIRGVEASAIGFLHLFDDGNPVGVRYDGMSGNTKFGASYHNFDTPSGDLDSFALAINHTFSGPSSLIDYMIYGGLEYVDFGTNDDTSYRVGVEGYTDRMTVGLSYSDKGFPFGTKFTSAYLDYRFWDALTVTGSLGHADVAGGRNFYGVGAQYDFLTNAYVKASVVDFEGSTSPIYEMMLGWEF